MAFVPWLGLYRERSAAIQGIGQLENETFAFGDNWTVAYIDARTELLNGYWQRFQNAQRQLLVDHSGIDAVEETITAHENSTARTYADLKAELSRLKLALQAAIQPPARIPRASEVKISTFAGKYTEWTAWRAEFKAKVLDTRMESADKIGLLMSSLKHEAAACAGRAERLDELELTRIWTKLDKTYDNTYQQVYAHICCILALPAIAHPSAEKLRAMIDTVDEHLRMLKRHAIETDHWSPIVCVMLLAKLDSETRHQWETKATLPPKPDLDALFVHMEQRILAIRNVEQSAHQAQPHHAPASTGGKPAKPNKANGHENNRYHPYRPRPSRSDGRAASRERQQSEVPTCSYCANGTKHHLWRCDGFRALETAKKFEHLRKAGLCEICLVARHAASDCAKGLCPKCKTGKHNSFLCSQQKSKQVHHVRNGRSRRRTNQHA